MRSTTSKSRDGVADERIYLGGVELFRRRSVDGSGNLGTVNLERETLHVMDDTRRVAMAETLTVDSGGTEPIAVGQTRWCYQLDDHLGSSTMEVDDAAQVISYEEYHPYGSTAFHLFSGSAEVSGKRYRYTGKEKDDETGLYYHGARYYAPWLGRWTAADPHNLDEVRNAYEYVSSRPILMIDPDGKNGAVVTLARTVLTGIAADVAVPEPTDAVPWKWVGYGVLAAAAATTLYFAPSPQPIPAPPPPVPLPVPAPACRSA